jgi:hypothetical protein
MLSVRLLSVIKLSVRLFSVIMLSVIMLSVIILNVITLSVAILTFQAHIINYLFLYFQIFARSSRFHLIHRVSS